MGKKNDSIHQLLTTLVAAAGIASTVTVTAKAPGAGVPRGADVEPLAGGCNIGSFPQTTKAGRYNVLCNTMQDAEKCLAFIKGHFEANGDTNKTNAPDKMQYCLEELGKVLGADPL
jgi:hypothetical protein